jgi:tetratricopeptide (TPR) repeat protein
MNTQKAPQVHNVERVIKRAFRDLRRGRYGSVAAWLDRTLRGAPDAQEPRALLEAVFREVMARSESDRAPLLDEILDYRVAGMNLALLALAAGDSQSALDWSERLLEDVPDDPAALTLQSLAYEFRGEYESALAVCNQLTAVQPSSPVAFYRRAAVRMAIANQAALEEDAALAKKNYSRAVQDFDVVVRFAPDTCRAYLERGRARVRLGNAPDAEADFGSAIDCDPNLVDAYNARGFLRESLGEYEQALADYDAVVRLSPELGEGYLERGRVRAEMGQTSEAEQDFARVLQLDPGLVEVYYEQGKLAESLGTHDQALQHLQEFARQAPEDVRGYIAIGDIRALLGDHQGAGFAYGEALSRDQKNLEALRGRALALLNLGDRYLSERPYSQGVDAYESALRDCDSILAIDTNDVQGRWYRGLALRALDGYDLAAAEFDRALQPVPPQDVDSIATIQADLAESVRLWGEHVGARDKLVEAVEGFRKALALASHQGLPWVLGAMGTALTSLERYSEAEALLQEALTMDAADAWARVEFGKLLLLTGRFKDAQKQFGLAIESSMELGSPAPWAHVGLALSLQGAGSGAAADDAYAAALDDPPTGTGYLQRGSILEDFGGAEALARAAEDYRQALALDPRSADAYNAIAWLYADKLPTVEHLKEALGFATTAVELAGASAELGFCLDTLGWVQYRLGRLEEAVRTLTEAQSLAPYRLIRRFHLDVATQGAEGHR